MGARKKITFYVINIVIIDCSIKVYGAIAAGSISYSFSYPQITDADQQEHHLSLVPPPAIPPSPAHANSISPDPACAIAPALAFFLHPQSTYIRHYLIIVQYLQPIPRWILRGDTLALQSFSPLRASFPQTLLLLLLLQTDLFRNFYSNITTTLGRRQMKINSWPYYSFSPSPGELQGKLLHSKLCLLWRKHQSSH